MLSLGENHWEEAFVTENCDTDFQTPPKVVHDGSNEGESFVLSRIDNQKS